MAIEQIHLLIRGRVQGVFYRKSAAEAANALKLKGFVRNLDDGRVELVAQGEKKQLLAILQWCQDGPPLALVEEIDSTWTKDLDTFQSFQIR